MQPKLRAIALTCMLDVFRKKMVSLVTKPKDERQQIEEQSFHDFLVI